MVLKHKYFLWYPNLIEHMKTHCPTHWMSSWILARMILWTVHCENTIIWWRDGSAVKSTFCSSFGIRFPAPTSCGSQTPVTSAPGNLMFSLSFRHSDTNLKWNKRKNVICLQHWWKGFTIFTLQRGLLSTEWFKNWFSLQADYKNGN